MCNSKYDMEVKAFIRTLAFTSKWPVCQGAGVPGCLPNGLCGGLQTSPEVNKTLLVFDSEFSSNLQSSTTLLSGHQRMDLTEGPTDLVSLRVHFLDWRLSVLTVPSHGGKSKLAPCGP